MRFWIGARGADMGAQARGITAVAAGEADSPLAGGALADRGIAVEAPSPTWLAPHPRLDVIYAALEGSGRLAAYRRTGETTLEPLGAPVEAGEAVCHIAVAPDGSRLVASCWGDGRVVHVPLGRDGALGAPSLGRAAADPYTPGDAVPDWALGEPAPTVADEAAALEAIAARAAEETEATETASGFLLPDAGEIDRLLGGGGGAGGAAAESGAGAPDRSGAAPDGSAVDEGAPAPGRSAAVPDRSAPDARADAAAPASSGTDARASRAAAPRGAARSGAASSLPEPRPSRAHSAAFLPDGRVATTDLGYDLVRVWRVAPSGLVPDHEIVLPFGVGPRHMVVHPSGHLHVVTEFSCEVWTLRAGPDGRWAVVGATPTGALAGDTGAELAAGADRGFLYAGLRGSDTFAVLRVAGEGERLEPVALVETGIRTPRHHVIVRDALLVAGQGSHEIASLPVDTRTGVPGAARRRLETPTPQHILPAA